MHRIHSLKELHVWKVARNLVEEVYNQSDNIKNRQFYLLLLKTSESVFCTITEGCILNTLEHFKNSLAIAAVSCKEVCDLLYTARCCKYLDEKGIGKVMLCCKEVLVEISIMKCKIGARIREGNN
ncbi:four helix bundle protein [Odoribacter lunatus]|uniref:four helix bundle protein n=1 Tax=Odoribacter lunatus TaxID=2941335 RepID=UPI0024085AB5|nr:four helix bundle protein [Odoribacter lunatus]